ncbi:MAG: hypothetical protein ACRD6N_03070, partial [Pyrinomonadaceae bacterium]
LSSPNTAQLRVASGRYRSPFCSVVLVLQSSYLAAVPTRALQCHEVSTTSRFAEWYTAAPLDIKVDA